MIEVVDAACEDLYQSSADQFTTVNLFFSLASAFNFFANLDTTHMSLICDRLLCVRLNSQARRLRMASYSNKSNLTGATIVLPLPGPITLDVFKASLTFLYLIFASSISVAFYDQCFEEAREIP